VLDEQWHKGSGKTEQAKQHSFKTVPRSEELR
jgi:hypothetical protein